MDKSIQKAVESYLCQAQHKYRCSLVHSFNKPKLVQTTTSSQAAIQWSPSSFGVYCFILSYACLSTCYHCSFVVSVAAVTYAVTFSTHCCFLFLLVPLIAFHVVLLGYSYCCSLAFICIFAHDCICIVAHCRVFVLFLIIRLGDYSCCSLIVLIC